MAKKKPLGADLCVRRVQKGNEIIVYGITYYSSAAAHHVIIASACSQIKWRDPCHRFHAPVSRQYQQWRHGAHDKVIAAVISSVHLSLAFTAACSHI